MGWCRGSLGGKKLRCCGVRPHLNPLPGGEEVASLPPFWILVPYRGAWRALRGNDEFRGNGVVAWYGESAWRILPRLTPAPAGDKPPHYISPVPHSSGFRPSPVGVVAWYRESAWRILPRLTPAPAGDKPPHYISPLPHPSGFQPSPVGVVAWYGESAWRILPRPTPTPAGDEPLASRSFRPRYIPLPHTPSGFHPSLE